MSSPDYRYILVRLLDKLNRNHAYYSATAERLRTKLTRDDLSHFDRAIAEARENSITRVVNDLAFILDRAYEHLTEEDIEEVESFNRQDYHDRHHSVPSAG